MTRTLKEEENVARACAYFAQSRSKGGAPFGVSELISNSSADVGIGSALLPQVRFALELCLVASPLYSSEDPHLWAFGKVRLLEKAQSPCRGES